MFSVTTPIRMDMNKTNKTKQILLRIWAKKNPYSHRWNVSWCSCYENKNMFFKNIALELPYYPIIPGYILKNLLHYAVETLSHPCTLPFYSQLLGNEITLDD